MAGHCASTRSLHQGRYAQPGCSIFSFSEYEFCLHSWTLVQECCRVATTKISNLTAMPLVPVCLAFSFTTHLLGKSRDMNASLFFNIAKRQAEHIIEHISFQKGWVAPLWQLRKTEGNGRETCSYKMVPFLGHKVQACKQNSCSGKKSKSNIGAKYTSVQNGVVMKRGGWCTRPHHFVRRTNHWNPISL